MLLLFLQPVACMGGVGYATRGKLAEGGSRRPALKQTRGSIERGDMMRSSCQGGGESAGGSGNELKSKMTCDTRYLGLRIAVLPIFLPIVKDEKGFLFFYLVY